MARPSPRRWALPLALCGVMAAGDCGGPEAVCGNQMLQLTRRAEPARLPFPEDELPAPALVQLDSAFERKKATCGKMAMRLESFWSQLGYSKEQDLYVTMGDHAGAKHFWLWMTEMKSFGMGQLLIVALDDSARDSAWQTKVPAVDRDFLPVWEVGEDHGNGTDHGLKPTLKFLALKLLLKAGFKRVIYTEMDVFFFENPSRFYPPKGVAYAGLRPAGRGNESSLGFMVFSGDSSLPLLDDYLEAWKEKEPAESEEVFNALLKNHTKELTSISLCKEKFAQGPASVTNDTVVARVTMASAGCKDFMVDEFYGQMKNATQEAFIKLFERAKDKFKSDNATEDWMDC